MSSHDPVACSAGFLEKLRRIDEAALVEWDRMCIDVDAYADEAPQMWFYATMDVLHGVKFLPNGTDIPYITVHGSEVAAWLLGRWIVRQLGESSLDYWYRLGVVAR